MWHVVPRGVVVALADDAIPLLFPVCPVEDWERVSFGVEHPAVERDEVLVREEEVQVLQPEMGFLAFHLHL